MGWLQLLAAELAITISDPSVWLAIGLALLLGSGCLVFGIWVARAVGLLAPDAPAGETLGVGLTAGLMVLAAWWAATWSGGRSSFTPVAVGFAMAVALAVIRRAAGRADQEPRELAEAENGAMATSEPRSSPRRPMILACLGGALFVVAIALLYGATLAPSPRDGVQPVEFRDEAFYAVLGRDLATTGTETNLSPSGFDELPGQPPQTWYHWGELWLASAVITVFGAAPLAARYFVVLPLLLLAAAALTGTLVRRLTGASSNAAYLLGFVACLFLAPVPLVDWFFGTLLFGMIFGITPYGFGAVAALLALYALTVLGRRMPTWSLASFVGSAVAFILPAHVVIAVLALVGVGFVWAIRIARSLIARRLPAISSTWRRTFVATGIALIATVAWGVLTGHGLGTGAPSSGVSPFNESWRLAMAITVLGAGMFLTIPIEWILTRRAASLQADLYLGTMALIVAGAIVWGARLGDFNMFYLFFGGLAVFATPLAAVATSSIWKRLRDGSLRPLAIALLAVVALQLQIGVGIGIIRLRLHGAGAYPPVPVSILRAIGDLPSDAKLAYACQPFEEVSFGTANLLSIDAHVGRRVVPMCFEADVFSIFSGGTPDAQTPNPSFLFAPQHTLYPDSGAHPPPAVVEAFLKGRGIDYILADPVHPNSLVPGAVRLAQSGLFVLLELP